jgi:hypothetical protein
MGGHHRRGLHRRVRMAEHVRVTEVDVIEGVQVGHLLERLLRPLLALVPLLCGLCSRFRKAFARRDRQRVLPESLLRTQDVTSVGPRFDLPNASLPVLLVRVVALVDGVELEAHRRVANLRAAQDPEPPLHVLAQHRGLDLLDAQEVLLVQGAEALDALLELFESGLDLGRVHDYGSSPRCAIASRSLTAA